MYMVYAIPTFYTNEIKIKIKKERNERKKRNKKPTLTILCIHI